MRGNVSGQGVNATIFLGGQNLEKTMRKRPISFRVSEIRLK